jgi:tetratricopeptide (TPR) repeat protein
LCAFAYGQIPVQRYNAASGNGDKGEAQMDWLTGVVCEWAFNEAMALLLRQIFPDDADFQKELGTRLDNVANKWREELPEDAFLHSIRAIFAASYPSDPEKIPPEPIEVHAKLKILQLPTPSDWLSALLRQWEWVCSVVPERQPFFTIDKARAETLLGDLAKRLATECRKDRVLFQGETLAQFAALRAELADVKNAIALVHDKQDTLLVGRQETSEQQDKGGFHSDIDTARDFTKAGQPDVTIAQLEALERRSWDKLTDRERFRLLANIGHAYHAKDEMQKAAEYFIKCAQYQRKDVKARGLEAVGYFMLKENERALQIAEDTLNELPNADLASAIRIRCQPTDKTIAEIEPTVPAHLKTMPETRLALSLRALHSENYAEAEKYARLAFEPERDSSVVAEHLAIVLLNSVRKQSQRQLSMPAQMGPLKERLIEAQSFLDIAAQGTPLSANTRVGRIAFFKGVAAFLLDDTFSAEGFFRTAFDSNPQDVDYIRHLAIIYYELERRDDSIRILRDGLKHDGTGVLGMMLASCLLQRKSAGDEQAAIETLESGRLKFADFAPAIRESYVDMISRAYGAAQRHADAAALLDSEKAHLSTETFHILKAAQLRRAGSKEEAAAEIRTALAAIVTVDDPATRRMVAEELTSQQLWREALPIWKELVQPDGFGPYTAGLLQCAWNANDHGFILAFCAQLRRNGINEPDTFHLEINTLWQYNGTDAAIAAIQSYLSNPEDQELAKELRLRLAHLAILLGRKDLECFDLPQLPSADDARPDLGSMAVALLIHGPRPLDAVEYAYTLVRRHFGVNPAHKAMILSVLWRPKDLKLPESETVLPDFAVRYKNNDNDEEHWHIIEDGPSPDMSRHEYSPTHAMSVAMLGKRVDETFTIRQDEVQEKYGTVLEIRSKLNFRFNRCLEEWETRFPEDRWLWKFSSKPSDDPKKVFEPAFKSIDKQAAFLADREKDYRNNPLASATIFAAMIDVSVLEAVQHLSSKEELPLRCWLGSKEEAARAGQAFNGTQTLIVDGSALATLFVTGLFKELSGVQCRIVVSRGTMLDLRQRLLEMRNAGNRQLTKDGDKHVFLELSVELVAQRIAAMEEFIQTVETECEIKDGIDLANIPVATRELLLQAMDRAAAETIAIAQKHNYVLWSDDFVVSAVASEQCKVSRVWTDFVLQTSITTWQMGNAKRHRYIALLEICGFLFTRVTVDAVTLTCQDAEWNLDDARLKTILKWFGMPELNARLIAEVTRSLLPQVWQKAPTKLRADSIINRILSNICRRSDAKQIFTLLHKQMDSACGVDVFAARALKMTLDVWIRAA